MMVRTVLKLACAMALAPAYVHGQTAIVPNAPGTPFSTGTVVTTNGSTTTISGGTQRGGNLFQSFQSFSLQNGDYARWTADQPTTILNVINRVTTNAPSTIDGTIDTSALPNASFFFISPGGIVFGSNFQMNVAAAAHFSTASELRFSDSTAFSAVTSNGSQLTSANPASFGFLGNESDVIVNGPQYYQNAKLGLSISAPNLQIQGSALSANSLQLTAVGNVMLALPIDQINTGSATGLLNISNSQIYASSAGSAAPLDILAGRLIVDNSTLSIVSSPDLKPTQAVLRADRMTLTNSTIETFTNTPSPSAPLMINGRFIDLSNSHIQSTSTGAGDASTVSINAEALSLRRSSGIFTSSFVGGSPLDLNIKTSRLSLDNSSLGVASNLSTARSTGSLNIQADAITLANSATIFADTEGAAPAANVSIIGGNLDVESNSQITSTSHGSGAAGTISLTGSALTVGSKAYIVSQGQVSGRAGSININENSVIVTDGGSISVDAGGKAAGGDVNITTKSLSVSSLGNISSTVCGDNTCTGTGAGGRINVQATAVNFSGGGGLAGSTNGSIDGSSIYVTADTVTLDNGFFIATSTGTGAGGAISVNADTIHLGNLSGIQSNAFSVGSGGPVAIMAKTISFDGDSGVGSVSIGSGNSGAVFVKASQNLALSNAQIQSSTTPASTGRSGAITVVSPQISLTSNGLISAENDGAGAAGSISIQTTALSLNSSKITSAGTSLSSGAGNIGISASGGMTLTNASDISTTIASAGSPGSVSITAGHLSLNASKIESNITGSSSGTSTLDIMSGDLSISNGGSVTATSASGLGSGSITISTASADLTGAGSQISTSNTFSAMAQGGASPAPTGPLQGNAGSVQLSASQLVVSDGASISSNAVSGAAGNINLSIAPTGLVILEGVTNPGVITTSSGSGTGGKISISDPLAIISDGGSLLALGQLGGANVGITSRYFISSADRLNTIAVDGSVRVDSNLFDASSTIEPQALAYVDPAGVLSSQCRSTRLSGTTSRLSFKEIGPFVRIEVGGSVKREGRSSARAIGC